jgi:hypothetical protein
MTISTGSGERLSLTPPMTYDKLDKASFRNRLGRVTQYVHHANWHLIRVTDPLNRATPVARKQLALELGEFAPWSAHQIIGSTLPKILQVVLADHSAIKHHTRPFIPYLFFILATISSMGHHVGGVPVENLLGHREALRGDHRREEDLPSVRTMVTGVTAPSGFHPRRFSFKIGAP